MKDKIVIKTSQFPRELVEQIYRDIKKNEHKRPRPKKDSKLKERKP